MRFLLLTLASLAFIACAHTSTPSTTASTPSSSAPGAVAHPDVVGEVPAGLLIGTHQLTMGGTRSGEGYFSPDGELMIFQSERQADNPFYQMYITNMKSGETKRLSNGTGKVTCGWVSPDKKFVTFASTHADKEALQKEQAELDFRKSGQTRRYSWDYDPNYDIYKVSIDGKSFKNLTHTHGYNAEGSMSPNGKYLVFASNRHAYDHKLSADEEKKLAQDPSYFIDIYIMNIDGTNVRQLTTEVGYDGGPFFSPDGNRIIYRHFSEDGTTAEVYTMKLDGSDKKQITHIGAMSWAPFYHPSGDYIVFTTSVYGFQNFELFIVDTEGKHKPVRVTNLDGFDGLPVFTPDGAHLTWNHKISSTESQIMIADWDDNVARAALELPPKAPHVPPLKPEISATDLKSILHYLASKEMRGRRTGSPEEIKMSHALATYYKEAGLTSPRGVDNFIQPFPFVKDAVLGSGNQLLAIHSSQQSFELNKDWRPLAFSDVGEFSASSVVFAGYGMRAPGDQQNASYDSYAGIDVKGKWVMVFRYEPDDVPAPRKLFLKPYSSLELKSALAKDLGARGIIFVTGPRANAKDSLIPFRRLTGANIGLPAISISDALAEQFLRLQQKDVTELQASLDKEMPFTPFEFQNVRLAAGIDIHMQNGEGHNTIGYVSVPGATHTLIIGAHGDHLGDEPSDASLATKDDKDPIHYGADDNASGSAAVLKLAHYFANLKKTNPTALKQNLMFVIWSGEEIGTLGSNFFIKNINKLHIKPSAYINFDMVGRWKFHLENQTRDPLLVQGVGSSADWRPLVESMHWPFSVQLQDDPYLPTDAMPVYLGHIPVINFFTGAHIDYHTPRDTEDKINFVGLTEITEASAHLAERIASQDKELTYQNVPQKVMDQHRGFRIFLGTIPDYSEDKIKGVKLSGVITGGPAEKAGLRGGDVIVEFLSKKIENIHDYVFALELAKPNEATKIVILRNGQREEISITPLAKE
jgi:Tol biopolymer transport system component